MQNNVQGRKPGSGFFRELSAVFARAFDGFQDQAGHAILFTLVWGSLFLAFGFSLLFVIIFVISSLVKSGLDSESAHRAVMAAGVVIWVLFLAPWLGGGIRAGILVCRKELKDIGIITPLLGGFRRMGPLVGTLFAFNLLNLLLGMLVIAIGYSLDPDFREIAGSLFSGTAGDPFDERILHLQAWLFGANLLAFLILIRFILVYPLVLEGGTVFYSFRSSWRLTSGHVPLSVVTILATALAYSMGFVMCGVGLLVSVPVMFALYGSLYLHLSSESDQENQVR